MEKENKKINIPEAPKRSIGITKYQIKKNVKQVLTMIARYALLISVSYIVLYPLFALIAYTPMSRTDILDPSVIWFSKHPTKGTLVAAWGALDYLNGLSRTLLVGIVSAIIEVFTCAIAAYGFARFEFKGKNLLFALVLLTAIVPVQILAIPLYLNFRYLDFFGLTKLIGGAFFDNPDFVIDLTETPFTFWLPSLFGVGLRSGLFIFIYRQFFVGLPKELEEASWIDGAGPLKTFFKVVIPSSGVVFLTVTIFSIIWHWNEYHLSVLYFNNKHPLAVALSGVVSYFTQSGINYETAQGAISAACLLFIAPVLIMYMFMQRKFIQSVDRVGIVG